MEQGFQSQGLGEIKVPTSEWYTFMFLNLKAVDREMCLVYFSDYEKG